MNQKKTGGLSAPDPSRQGRRFRELAPAETAAKTSAAPVWPPPRPPRSIGVAALGALTARMSSP